MGARVYKILLRQTKFKPEHNVESVLLKS